MADSAPPRVPSGLYMALKHVIPEYERWNSNIHTRGFPIWVPYISHLANSGCRFLPYISEIAAIPCLRRRYGLPCGVVQRLGCSVFAQCSPSARSSGAHSAFSAGRITRPAQCASVAHAHGVAHLLQRLVGDRVGLLVAFGEHVTHIASGPGSCSRIPPRTSSVRLRRSRRSPRRFPSGRGRLSGQRWSAARRLPGG